MFKIVTELTSCVSLLIAPTGFSVSSTKLSYRLFQNQFHCHSNAEVSVNFCCFVLGGLVRPTSRPGPVWREARTAATASIGGGGNVKEKKIAGGEHLQGVMEFLAVQS